ncbi:Hpt domain-containing protein [Duganella sp. sic0402]|uniref:Hpt domain-containing protein n=1 Tax=Duganella sp. sic0402 TaxID=2854786 RepID=UPI001C44B24A|nr:Hpt domain-containing protein [Duganella sp. sic0402]MBV7534726.1 Hpt domain-containing protein [Duganella sp. sic0402]
MNLSKTIDAAAAAEEGAVLPELPELAGVDLAGAYHTLGSNHALLLRAAQAFLREYTAVPRTIAVCHLAGDYAEVGRIAHTLKGAASYLCARGLSVSAAALETAAYAADEKAVSALMAAFVNDMVQVLDGLSRFVVSRSGGSAHTAASSAPRRDAALALALRIAPLLENGDYAAIPLLEQLAGALQSGPLAASATAIIDQFEELDIDGAVKLLSSLTQTLRATQF